MMSISESERLCRLMQSLYRRFAGKPPLPGVEHLLCNEHQTAISVWVTAALFWRVMEGYRVNVVLIAIPRAPPLAHCKPENRSLAGPFSLCAKGVCRDHPPFGDWPTARNRSPNAHRLFSPAPRSRRDGFKTPIDFNELTGSHCGRVSLVPACLKADGDATRAAWSLV